MTQASYGVSFYGTDQYGGSVAGAFLDAAVKATCTDYGTVTVTWSNPDGPWSKLRLLRGHNGAPITVEDGVILLEREGRAETIHVDRDIPTGQRYHYAVWLFVYTTQEWVLAGSDDAFVTINYGTTDTMWDRVPQMYKVAGNSPTGVVVEGSQLYRFLSLFGFHLDSLRADAESILSLANPSRAASFALPLILRQFGLTTDPVLGPRIDRALAASAPQLLMNKGTYTSVENLATVITGWDVLLGLGYNLMLDSDDSLTTPAIGRWNEQSVNATVTGLVPTQTIAPAYGTGFTAVTAASNGSVSVSTATQGLAARRYAAPVAQDVTHVGSIYVRGGTAARLIIDWYDKDGDHLSSALGVSTPTTADSWSRITASGSSPDGTVRAALRVVFSYMATGAVVYLNAAQLERGDDPREWEPPRQAQLYLQADLINEILNPDGTTGTQGWAANTGLSSSATGFTYTWD